MIYSIWKNRQYDFGVRSIIFRVMLFTIMMTTLELISIYIYSNAL